MQTRDNTALQLAIDSLIDTLPAAVDENWFGKATLGLATAVGADVAMIGRLVDNGTAIETLGFCENRRLLPNIVYRLQGTPCADVLEESVCVIPDRVAELYPADRELQELSAVGYAGQPILDDARRLLGITNAIFRTPVRDPESLQLAFESFSRGLTEKLREELVHWVDGPKKSG